MSRISSLAGATLMVALGATTLIVFADDPNPEPELKTSTGRELNGPGTHHAEYATSSADTLHPCDTVCVRMDSMRQKPIPPSQRRRGTHAPVPGVDDKSSTRPGE